MEAQQYEQQRLNALYSFHILDTPKESHFDQLLKLVAARFSVPMCFINLVDENRFWFKASYGADVEELCRSPGFCETTLQNREFYQIPDATREPAVSMTEWVQGSAGVRFYAGSPLLTVDGFAIGTLCMFDTRPRNFDLNDIGDLEAFAAMVMRLVELNRLRNTQLRDKNLESVGRLTGGVAHDFNNQLSGITAALDLLESQPGLSPVCVELLSSIRECTQRSGDLVSKLLNLSRSRRYERKLFDVHEMLDELYALMARTIDPGIELVREFGATSSACLGDRSQLNSGLLNILVNARDALPDGGRIVIRTSDCKGANGVADAGPEHPGILVQIADNGGGIPFRDIDRVFEPFYTTKPAENGTGLGLPSALEVVKHHGGTIQVESSEQGSTFSIYLPVEPVVDAPVGEAAEIPERDTGNRRVMLVEDEDVLRKLYAMLLTDLGYEVISRADGRLALDTLETDQDFDLLITDIKMPAMDGFELHEALVAMNSKIPVLMISGFSDQGRVDRLCDQGLIRFLQKPFTAEQLAEVIDDSLQTRQ